MHRALRRHRWFDLFVHSQSRFDFFPTRTRFWIRVIVRNSTRKVLPLRIGQPGFFPIVGNTIPNLFHERIRSATLNWSIPSDFIVDIIGSPQLEVVFSLLAYYQIADCCLLSFNVNARWRKWLLE